MKNKEHSSLEAYGNSHPEYVPKKSSTGWSISWQRTCSLQIVGGVTCVALGIIAIVCRVYSTYCLVGAGIWGGALFIATGGLGLSLINNLTKCGAIAGFILALASSLVAIAGTVLYGLGAYAEATGPDMEAKYNLTTACKTNIAAGVSCLIQIPLAISSAVVLGQYLSGPKATAASTAAFIKRGMIENLSSVGASLRGLSISQIVFGIMAAAFGSLAIVHRFFSNYCLIGAGIWGGVLAIGTGSTGLSLVKEYSRAKGIAVFALSLTSGLAGIAGMVLYGLGAYIEAQAPILTQPFGVAFWMNVCGGWSCFVILLLTTWTAVITGQRPWSDGNPYAVLNTE